VSQEEWTKLREIVPYVKIYRYNPKHLYPKLNGYGDNGQRKAWSSGGFHTLYLPADSLVHARPSVRYHITAYAFSKTAYFQADKVDQTLRDTDSLPSLSCIVLGTLKDNCDMSASVFVVQFNGFMSLTS
jgi:hypothetical protein